MTWAESETLEFKASFGEWKEAVQTLCAFANAKGGTVAVGIDDAGQPTGLEIGKGAIINAVVHRDYSDAGQVQVRIFSDRLEVWSPGPLANGVPVELLESQGRSVPRNRLLARLFRRAGVIESFGTGFQRMAQACRDEGKPGPQFFEAAGAFVVAFSMVTPLIALTPDEGVSEGVSEGVLLALIRENPDLRLPQLAARLDAAPKTVERWLASLRRGGAVEFHGSPKTGGYRIAARLAGKDGP